MKALGGQPHGGACGAIEPGSNPVPSDRAGLPLVTGG